MSHGERKGGINLVKFLELGFSIACLVLHFYSFDDRDIVTSFLATGTFAGYIVVIVGVFAGALMRASIHRRIDIFFSVLGCALFVASGVFIIEAWEYSFRTRTRDLALIKASLAIVNGVLFGFDAIFTFRDKYSVYSANIIVTAAHCLQFVSNSVLSVRAGSTYWNNGGNLVSVAAFRNHNGYTATTMVNDIAVIRLSSPLAMSTSISAIGLATTAPANGAAASVSGWGTTSFGSSSIPTQLRAVDVLMVSRAICASSTYGTNIKDTMICAYAVGKGACQGDSGGPLVSGDVLVGVASWGYGCAFANYPDVYADVAALHTWVISTASTV